MLILRVCIKIFYSRCYFSVDISGFQMRARGYAYWFGSTLSWARLRRFKYFAFNIRYICVHICMYIYWIRNTQKRPEKGFVCERGPNPWNASMRDMYRRSIEIVQENGDIEMNTCEINFKIKHVLCVCWICLNNFFFFFWKIL